MFVVALAMICAAVVVALVVVEHIEILDVDEATLDYAGTYDDHAVPLGCIRGHLGYREDRADEHSEIHAQEIACNSLASVVAESVSICRVARAYVLVNQAARIQYVAEEEDTMVVQPSFVVGPAQNKVAVGLGMTHHPGES